jgi:hypothetical protein
MVIRVISVLTRMSVFLPDSLLYFLRSDIDLVYHGVGVIEGDGFGQVTQ